MPKSEQAHSLRTEPLGSESLSSEPLKHETTENTPKQ